MTYRWRGSGEGQCDLFKQCPIFMLTGALKQHQQHQQSQQSQQSSFAAYEAIDMRLCCRGTLDLVASLPSE